MDKRTGLWFKGVDVEKEKKIISEPKNLNKDSIIIKVTGYEKADEKRRNTILQLNRQINNKEINIRNIKETFENNFPGMYINNEEKNHVSGDEETQKSFEFLVKTYQDLTLELNNLRENLKLIDNVLKN